MYKYLIATGVAYTGFIFLLLLTGGLSLVNVSLGTVVVILTAIIQIVKTKFDFYDNSKTKPEYTFIITIVVSLFTLWLYIILIQWKQG